MTTLTNSTAGQEVPSPSQVVSLSLSFFHSFFFSAQLPSFSQVIATDRPNFATARIFSQIFVSPLDDVNVPTNPSTQRTERMT